MTDIQVDTATAFLTIAKALDYVGIDDVHHAHRVAYIAFHCAKQLGWDRPMIEKAYYSGLLHDCGVLSSEEHKRLLQNLAPMDVNAHCEAGYEALLKTQLLSPFANIVRYHHTPWRDLQHEELSDEDRQLAALIHISDRLDFLRSRYADEHHPDVVTLHEGLIAENLLAHKGELFEPIMTDALAKIVQTDGFWFAMEPYHIERIPYEFTEFKLTEQLLEFDQLVELATFLARIVDAKSPITFQHSERVAKIAKELAMDLDIAVDTCDEIFVAGLLHDVGKLRTPDSVLNHEGALDDHAKTIIKRHAVDTQLTLDGLFPRSNIGRWAANHHERIDGSGYPFKLKDQELDLPSRIVAIADVFQALTQKRPYKGHLNLEEVLSIIEPMVHEGQLDKQVYAVLLARKDKYFDLSHH